MKKNTKKKLKSFICYQLVSLIVGVFTLAIMALVSLFVYWVTDSPEFSADNTVVFLTKFSISISALMTITMMVANTFIFYEEECYKK